MKSHTVRLKQDNMLCHRCLLNVVQRLSQFKSVKEFDVNLDTKRIKIRYNDSNLSREEIVNLINDSIVKGVKLKS